MNKLLEGTFYREIYLKKVDINRSQIFMPQQNTVGEISNLTASFPFLLTWIQKFQFLSVSFGFILQLLNVQR
jgi:hypothetical protein